MASVTVKQPVTKIPLADRKEVREQYEDRKARVGEDISDILGATWTVDLDPLLLYAYKDELHQGSAGSVGRVMINYATSARDCLRALAYNQGQTGKDILNSICYKHSLTLDKDVNSRLGPDENAGCEVRDGVLTMLFKEGQLGLDSGLAVQETRLLKALDVAPSPPGAPASLLKPTIRMQIATAWGTHESQLAADIAEQVGDPDFKIDPNFEDTFAKLIAAGTDVKSNWEAELGYRIWTYFSGFLHNIKVVHQFAKDEMVREEFLEAVTARTVRFRIVPKTKDDNKYVETEIQDGICYMQTTPAKYGWNSSDGGKDIVDIL